MIRWMTYRLPPKSGPALGGVEVMLGVKVLAHLKDLDVSAEENCQRPDHLAQLEQLLVHYQHTFSMVDEGVGSTFEVEHSILLKEGTRPIRQPPNCLGPRKEAEAEQQVQELLNRGLIDSIGR